VVQVGFQQFAPRCPVSVCATFEALAGADVSCSRLERYGHCVSDIVTGAPVSYPLSKLASVCGLSYVCVWLVRVLAQVLLQLSFLGIS
jgi:hypothetical protein